ncbi:pyridoxamine 5'-phosphate oxidase family protein [Protaetiibacter mangrovi]|uniref:pyridoxamine 5'-phosphate oxidase family protein n=1 Tax=Protaetiibacter mangrovi TaxID=2970926 RepID=UPI002163EC9A|nr:pyridoxamine 5'-phosphate oxidase family protein [Protaetiibacter mangrovi]
MLLNRARANGPVGEMGLELCWEVLERTEYGRLAVASGRGVEIFPVNYVVDGTRIYFRTGPGTKLTELSDHPQVALEVDGVDPDGAAAFSVIVKGRAERLEAPADIDYASALPLRPWTATRKLRWVRVRPDEVTGRVFRLGSEPESYV